MTNDIIMNIKHKTALFLILLLPSVSWAADLTGRFSMLGSTAIATQGDSGYINKDNTLTADQQSLRLMLDDAKDNSEWSLHAKLARIHLSNIAFNDNHSSDLFRYTELSSGWLDESASNIATRFGYEVDRAVYKQRYKKMTFAFGRQAIDFGSGRFWQPLNVFGSFAPTDLDTDYKPGIDAARLDWFTSDFSSLSAVYAFSPNDNENIKKTTNAALHYRSQVGEQSEYALLAATIIDKNIIGASFESSWSGMGWRIEGAHYNDSQTNENSLFWIAGVDYQFANDTLLTAEWYENSRGASSVAALSNTNLLTDALIKYGLQQQLSQRVFGLSINKEFTPLLNGAYTLLASPLKDNDGQYNTSLLHQFNLNYSVSNESDILFSLQFANGRGLNALFKPQSEFGHIPTSATIRLRFYF
ncbi:MAG: hypothetical protein KAT06_03555 [Gammaproteobacteria bacterium]|nr:hypothetical protein [Gammaproteobacteria bacterium]